MTMQGLNLLGAQPGGALLEGDEFNPRGYWEAAEIVASVSRYPQISSKVRAYQRVGSRRWDLQLENGIQVLLPENGLEAGLSRLAQLDEEKDIFNRAVERIDLRSDDRVVFRLEQGAADAMREVREEQIKRMEKAKRERQI